MEYLFVVLFGLVMMTVLFAFALLLISPLLLLGVAAFIGGQVLFGTYAGLARSALPWKQKFGYVSPNVLRRTKWLLAIVMVEATALLFVSAEEQTTTEMFVGMTALVLAILSLNIVTSIDKGNYLRSGWIPFVFALGSGALLGWQIIDPHPAVSGLSIVFLGLPWVLGSVFAGWQVMQINRRLGRGETLESMGLRTADSSVDEGEVREDAHAK